MNEAARIADQIRQRLPTLKRGALRFWGQWFGRPYDNIHTVAGASADGDALVVNFDNGETLLIVRPVNATIGGPTFTIRDAASLRWEWNAYGSPAGRRYFEEYVRNGDQIEATTDVDWFTPVLQPSGSEAAVEIL